VSIASVMAPARHGRARSFSLPVINDAPFASQQVGRESSFSALYRPAPGRRVNGALPGRRKRSASPTIDPAAAHLGFGACENDGQD
jgi:hypothetical protein